MNPFVQWLTSPLSQWHIASMQHKLLVGSAGAAMAWYLHTKKAWPGWKVALGGLGTAYGVSMILHAAKRFEVLPAVAPPQQVPPQTPVQPMPPGMNQKPPLDMDQKAPPTDFESEDDGMAGDDGIFG